MSPALRTIEKKIKVLEKVFQRTSLDLATVIVQIKHFSPKIKAHYGDRIIISRGYDYFRKKGPKLSWPRTVWNSWVTPKHAVTLWLAARRRLATKDRLSFLQMEEHCVLCVGNRESVAHLFFACEFSKSIWTHNKAWLNISRAMSTIDSALKWIKKESRGSGCSAKARCTALACTVYHIWNARNRRIFEGQTMEVEGIVFRIKLHVYRTIYSLLPQNGSDP